jgi:transposase-like protein
MAEWANRPLDRVYPVIFVDASVVKVRVGWVRNTPLDVVVMGVTTDGERDILGIWAGDGTEGAKFWLHTLTEIKSGCPRRSPRSGNARSSSNASCT